VFEQNNTKQHDHVLGDVEALILQELKGLSGGEIALVLQLLGKVGVSV